MPDLAVSPTVEPWFLLDACVTAQTILSLNLLLHFHYLKSLHLSALSTNALHAFPLHTPDAILRNLNSFLQTRIFSASGSKHLLPSYRQFHKSHKGSPIECGEADERIAHSIARFAILL